MIPTGAIALKTNIAEPVKQRRGTREYTMNKYYTRLVAGLGPVSKAQAAAVPALDPVRLYADTAPVSGSEREGQQELPWSGPACGWLPWGWAAASAGRPGPLPQRCRFPPPRPAARR